MHRNPSEQLNRSLLHVCATSALAVGMVVCTVSSAYAFSAGPLPFQNCLTPADCDLLHALNDAYDEVHQKITRTALSALIFVPISGGTPVPFSKKAMTTIEDANAKTDYNQADHSLHFDNAQFDASSTRLVAGKKFLIEKLQDRTTIAPDLAFGLRQTLGRYLHTLQDFYAHSNYSTLASPPPIKLGESQVPDPPPSSEPCLPGDTSTFSPEGLDDSLTSGEAGSLANLASAKAEEGKCAHGLVANGIHKDWNGRVGHDRAYVLAVIATRNFVSSIINDSSITNKDNVCVFMTDKPCQNSTFTCPDNNPNIYATAIISGYHGGDSKGADGPGPVQVSVSNDLGSATAGGEKGSGSVNFTARMVNSEGTGSRATVSYRESFKITSTSKALGSKGTAILTATGGASTSGTCQSDPMNGTDPVGGSASVMITDRLTFSIGHEARFGCPNAVSVPPPPTTATISFNYGQIIGFSVDAVAAGQFMGPPWGPSTSGSTTGSANVSYNVSVQNDPDAVVTWCRAPSQ